MEARLRKMTARELEAFSEYSVNDCANDLMLTGITREEALARAKAEFEELLPRGIDTPRNALMIVEDPSDGRAVGVIWYLFEDTDGGGHVFLADFVIKAEERRKGYAAAALGQMERDGRAHGLRECRLYVSADNLPAAALYEKCGYAPFRKLENGAYMRKVI